MDAQGTGPENVKSRCESGSKIFRLRLKALQAAGLVDTTTRRKDNQRSGLQMDFSIANDNLSNLNKHCCWVSFGLLDESVQCPEFVSECIEPLKISPFCFSKTFLKHFVSPNSISDRIVSNFHGVQNTTELTESSANWSDGQVSFTPLGVGIQFSKRSHTFPDQNGFINFEIDMNSLWGQFYTQPEVVLLQSIRDDITSDLGSAIEALEQKLHQIEMKTYRGNEISLHPAACSCEVDFRNTKESQVFDIPPPHGHVFDSTTNFWC